MGRIVVLQMRVLARPCTLHQGALSTLPDPQSFRCFQRSIVFSYHFYACKRLSTKDKLQGHLGLLPSMQQLERATCWEELQGIPHKNDTMNCTVSHALKPCRVYTSQTAVVCKHPEAQAPS